MNPKPLITPFLLLTLLTCHGLADPLGSAFTYQGRLNDAGQPVTGNFDLRLTLCDRATSGSTLGLQTFTNVPVANGLFAVPLDFGAGVFLGDARWLEIAVRTNGGGDFTLLSPRQALSPVPYSLFASNAAVASQATLANAMAPGAVTSASVASGQLVKTINGLTDGVTLASGNNATLTTNGGKLTFSTPADWHLDGNAKTIAGRDFLGTLDDEPLEFKVYGQRALRLEPQSTIGAPNVIGGSEVNWVGPSVLGAFIGGGGAANYITRSYTNYVGGNFSVVGGGRANSVAAERAVIAGGDGNTIDLQAHASAIGGGSFNAIQTNSTTSVIAGGTDNSIIDSANSTIAGGSGNVIQNASAASAIGGGYRNKVLDNSPHSLVAGGSMNQVQGYAEWATIGGGTLNLISSNANYATLAGGRENELQRSAQYGAIGGGYRNIIRDASWAAIGGGSGNDIGTNADGAVIPGGRDNQALGNTSLAAGYRAAANHDGTLVWSDHSTVVYFKSTGSNQFLIRAGGGVGIGKNNPASQLDVKGTVTATAFVGDGSGLTDVKVSAGGLTAGIITNTVTFNPASGAPFVVSKTNKVSNLNADFFDGFDSAAFWRTGGNSGAAGGAQFLGTTDNQSLELKVNGLRALRLEPNATSPNVIGGHPNNAVALGTYGAAIGGGGASGFINRVDANLAVIGGGSANSITNTAHFGTVSGGRENLIRRDSTDATIGGGRANVIGTNATYSTIGGGEGNQANGMVSTIGGGYQNQAAYAGTVSGGEQNAATGSHAAIAGGYLNRAEGDGSAVGGGQTNLASGDFATVPGGYMNAASGRNSLAAGRNAHAVHDFSFIWNDGQSATSTKAEQTFEVYARGGVILNTGDTNVWCGNVSCSTLTIRGGADLAEPFAMSDHPVAVGSVVIIDEQNPGRLQVSTQPYDQKVAGIVSGAGGVQSGISMLQTGTLEAGPNVALSGRVYALVDATQAPVKPGDLLTTSSTPGYAMKVTDRAKAQGAVLGKAMGRLETGRGLVLVLVTLQ